MVLVVFKRCLNMDLDDDMVRFLFWFLKSVFIVVILVVLFIGVEVECVLM